jgi:hypothetical protein
MSNSIPKPGSVDAVEQGCTCEPYVDETGEVWEETQDGIIVPALYWITDGCPIHDPDGYEDAIKPEGFPIGRRMSSGRDFFVGMLDECIVCHGEKVTVAIAGGATSAEPLYREMVECWFCHGTGTKTESVPFREALTIAKRIPEGVSQWEPTIID